MTLFDQLVTQALQNQPQLSTLRNVVEKELLHHDILRILRDHKLTSHLTFMGGTCLRCCYGGVRLSEDLDFTGGQNFSRETLSSMGEFLTANLHDKYGLAVTVTEPKRVEGNVDTWKLKIETRPENTFMPAQRIHIDICALPSYEKRPLMLRNPYGVEMGTSGLILQAQSREEIYADKLIAYALRPNRLKYRDLWDISWLHSQGVIPNLLLIPLKLKDRHIPLEDFVTCFTERMELLKTTPSMASEFLVEMKRFLPGEQIKAILEQEHLWGFILGLMEEWGVQIRHTCDA